jgi:hypothetical protein
VPLSKNIVTKYNPDLRFSTFNSSSPILAITSLPV